MHKYYGNLSQLKPLQQYMLLRQLHKAKRAGVHVDFRIGSPETGLFSWAAPKDLPTELNQKRLFITQPLHTYAYKDFLGQIKSKYGYGTVLKLELSPIVILLNTPLKIKFKRSNQLNPEVYTMVRTKNGNYIVTRKNAIHKKAGLTENELVLLSRPYYTLDRWKHIQEVLRQAKDIKQEPLSEDLKAIIYLHDSAKSISGKEGHLKASAILAKKLLQNKYDKNKLRKIYRAIQLHSPDYRQSKKNFSHSSPLALLLALADDSNNLRRDPDLMAMVSIKYNKQNPDIYNTVHKGLLRHKAYFGPLSGHPGLKYYKDRWSQYAKSGIDNILNYPLLKYKILWSLINKDTKLPDIDVLTKEL